MGRMRCVPNHLCAGLPGILAPAEPLVKAVAGGAPTCRRRLRAPTRGGGLAISLCKILIDRLVGPYRPALSDRASRSLGAVVGGFPVPTSVLDQDTEGVMHGGERDGIGSQPDEHATEVDAHLLMGSLHFQRPRARFAGQTIPTPIPFVAGTRNGNAQKASSSANRDAG